MKLYKKDTKGKIRFIESYSIDSIVYQISWLIDWKHTERKYLAKPKNIWKSNETSSEAQAAIEANSIMIKKNKEWYFTTIEWAENSNVIMPMLAKSYDTEKHKINYDTPVFIQPKFDWMRCLASLDKASGLIVILHSRKNRVISTLPHINEALMNHFSRHPDDIIDWELYAHWLSFQENMKLIKKHSDKSKLIKFNIYDIVTDKPFYERFQTVKEIHLGSDYLLCAETFEVFNEEDIKSAATIYVNNWYEGVMVRHWTDWYWINKRSSSLLKYKDFIDITQTVIDVIPSKKCPEQWVLVIDWNKDSFPKDYWINMANILEDDVSHYLLKDKDKAFLNEIFIPLLKNWSLTKVYRKLNYLRYCKDLSIKEFSVKWNNILNNVLKIIKNIYWWPLKMSHKEREEILLNKDNYIWQTAEIRFFEYTDDWLPRFPVCVWFRLPIDKTA